ncbi:hypothetical protein BC629DRAFT_622278 [Irpex lacteus]|nr:hypothetical protein BC629DRAFT_622278 [Irpex lacteus]
MVLVGPCCNSNDVLKKQSKRERVTDRARRDGKRSEESRWPPGASGRSGAQSPSPAPLGRRVGALLANLTGVWLYHRIE